MKSLLLLVCLISLFATAQNTNTQPQSVLIVEGDYKIRQLVVPGFDELPLQRKLFAYYLSMAGLAGKDIFWEQASREGLAIRELFGKLWRYNSTWTREQKTSISEYLFRMYGNHSNYDYMANVKLVLKGFTKNEFLALVQDVQSKMDEDGRKDIRLLSEAKRLWRDILDPEYKKAYMAGRPADLIADTRTNFYGEGFTQQDFERLTPQQQQEFFGYPRINEGTTQVDIARMDGRFGSQLTAVDYYFEEAQKYATDAEKEILSAYRKALRTGSAEDLRQAETLWVQHKATDIEFQIGFVEVYHDPMKIRGAWEAFVFLLSKDSETQKRVENIRKNASYFESNMPVDERFKKAPGFTPPQAEGAFMICAAGSCGERPFAGVNLPNDEKISDMYGTKSFGNLNVLNDLNQEGANTENHLKNWLPKEYHSFIPKFNYTYVDVLQVELHEILGHGSGQNLEGVNDGMMKETYSSLEEMRAETASLFHLMDPKMMEFGILPQMSLEEFEVYRKIALSMFFADYINKYELLADDAKEITQAHRRAALVMLNFLMDKGVVQVQTVEGEYPHVFVPDGEKARSALGELWSWIQTAKSTGDYSLSNKLFNEYAHYTDFHRNLRRLVKERIAAANLPTQTIHLNARMRLVRDRNGNIENVVLRYHNVKSSNQSAVATVVDKMYGNDIRSKRLIEESAHRSSCSRYFR